MKHIKQKAINIRKKIFRNKLQMLLLVLMFALTLNLVCVSYIMYVKKHRKPLMIYETTASFLTVYDNVPTTEEEQAVEEEKPIVIKKAKMNDKEDGQKKNRNAGNAQELNIYDALALYETPGSSAGIDVSKYQGKIDWRAVANSGIEFAMIRSGYRGNTYGTIVMDPMFEENIQGALKNGIKVGIYFYSTAVNEAEAREEARFTVEVIKKYPITYPVAYDFEDFDEYRCAYLGKNVVTNNALAFLNYIKSSGYTPMIYSNPTDFNNNWETSRFSGVKSWLAHYTANGQKSYYKGPYQMWQYTSKGYVPGISGFVDMNTAFFRYSKEPPAKAPEEPKKEETSSTQNQNSSTTEEKSSSSSNESSSTDTQSSTEPKSSEENTDAQS